MEDTESEDYCALSFESASTTITYIKGIAGQELAVIDSLCTPAVSVILPGLL
jgi:hypothetical protein